MKRTLIKTTTAFAATLGAMGPIHAADIDLFTTADGIKAPPNVYMMLDNTANWNSNLGDYCVDGNGEFDPDAEYDPDGDGNPECTTGKVNKEAVLRAVLKEVFIEDDDGDTDDTDGDSDLIGTGTNNDPIQLRLGFGLFSDGQTDGGVVYEAVQDFTPAYQDELAARDMFDLSVDPKDLKGNNPAFALAFNESFAYFAAQDPVSGQPNKKIPYDADAFDADNKYISPAAGNCGKNFNILIANGQPTPQEDGDAEAALNDRDGATDVITLDSNDSYESNWSDEFARFMARTEVVPSDVDGPNTDDQRGAFEQEVRTYVIDLYNPNSPQAGNNKFEGARALMKSVAKWGDGRYFAATSPNELREALTEILNELFSVNSVFASSTLPVSVNVRGTNLNQVYMGVFRPTPTGHTRWQGNLKLYQLAVDEDTNTLFLADKNGAEAQSPATGFIKNQAVSFWTHDSSYWDYDPRGVPESGSDLPDGPVVEKGGVHQSLRDQYPGMDSSDANWAEDDRPLLTLEDSQDSVCSDQENCDLVRFLNNQGSLSETVDDWIHGTNNVPDDQDDPDTLTDQEPRPSVHGDVLHSKPAVINYGDTAFDGNPDGDPDIYVFYGANDGIFHAVRGGQEDTDGEEVWGFIPREFFPRLERLRDRTAGKEYFADGGVGILRKDVDDDGKIEPGDGDLVHIFITMRRGGRLIYALDVTDPEDPEFLWKATRDREGYADLGQTWSEPNVSRVRWDDDGNGTIEADEEKDVLIFGGGYDPASEDPENTESPTDKDNDGATMGQSLYVVDAEDGSVIWKATNDPDTSALDHSFDADNMIFPIASNVTVIDRDNNGFADRVYVGDTGGQVWRADIAGDPGTDWGAYRLASVGEAADQAERKFLFAPDVVYDEERDGTKYDAVLLGSGDREAPYRESVTNRFYMFKDKATPGVGGAPDGSWPLTESDLHDTTANLIQQGTEEQQTIAENSLNAAEGWYITLENPGEKVVSSAVTLSGTTFFNTNEPPNVDAACGQALGTARFYEVAFGDGSATVENDQTAGLTKADRTTKATGGGFPPSPVPVIVEIDGKKYQAVISGTETKSPPGAKLDRRNPVYWEAGIDKE